MKNLLAMLFMGAIMGGACYAQSAQIKIKAKEKEIPAAVVESFNKDYAGMMAEEWTITPAAVVAEEYVVSGYDNLNGQKPTYYTVKMKANHGRGEAVYDASGKLLHSREVIKDTALPISVAKSISEKYPGYALVGDKEVIKSGKSTVRHYQVIIEKGKERKAIAVSGDGQVIKEFKFKS